MSRSFLASSLLALLAAAPALADEVNIYSHRQPELIQPLLDQFTAETGIAVNIAFVDKGMAERLKAEGDRSPADLVLTVDIGRLVELVNADVLQPVEDAVLTANIPAEYRDPGNLWFGLTTRARIVYASKDRVQPGEVTSYEDLADPKWQGRLCMRSGLSDYNVALTAAYLLHHSADETSAWLQGMKANLAHKPDRRRPRSGQVDLGRRMRHRGRQHLLHGRDAVGPRTGGMGQCGAHRLSGLSGRRHPYEHLGHRDDQGRSEQGRRRCS